MRTFTAALVVILLLGIAAPTPAACCLIPRLGVRVGGALPAWATAAVDAGIYGRVGLPFGLKFEPNVEYWSSPDGVSLLAGNLDLRWRADLLGKLLHPFIGVGLTTGWLWNPGAARANRVAPAVMAGLELSVPIVNFVLQGRHAFIATRPTTALTLGVDLGF